ncbi:TonB-dependent receptor [Billgrantia gudaonensis]|uniref:TonB-dependent receptor n=1 Tax=Billgrantia gudaonensis TaxID=376427 RepID=A0A432JJ69_9GAMM|nr:TonB-dependent receptor [Halomonas gudaonensis]
MEFTPIVPISVSNRAAIRRYRQWWDTESVNTSTFALNGENLTDKTYYSTVRGSTKHNYFGEPRHFTLTMQYRY